MGFLIIPTLIAILGPWPESREALADFSRFTKAVGREVSLVDRDGIVREGVVTAAAADAVTMTFGGGKRRFMRGDIASAERMKDSSIDGAVKGAIVGLFMGALATQGCPSQSACSRRVVWGSMAAWGTFGWALDATNDHRKLFYRAPAVPAPTVGLSFRF